MRGDISVAPTPVVIVGTDHRPCNWTLIWRSGEPDHLSRSDAIRTLLWLGLAAAYEERKRNGRKDG